MLHNNHLTLSHRNFAYPFFAVRLRNKEWILLGILAEDAEFQRQIVIMLSDLKQTEDMREGENKLVELKNAFVESKIPSFIFSEAVCIHNKTSIFLDVESVETAFIRPYICWCPGIF